MAGKAQKITIFYDGQCTMCSSLISTITTGEKGEQFTARNMHTSALPDKVTLADIDKEIYVTDASGKIYKNADAILKISEEYFNVRHLTTLGRLPVIKQLLTFGYTMVASNRHLLTGEISKLFWIKVTTTLAFLCGLIISYPLWISERLYPLLPAHPYLPTIQHPLDYILYFSLLFFLVWQLILPKPQKILWLSLGLLSILLLFDQSRMQPWVTQYFFMFALLALFSWIKADILGGTKTLNLLRIIIASIYLYSGLQKINLTFVTEVMPWMLQPVTSLLPQLTVFVPLLAIAAPCIQIFFALGLLTRRFRRISLILAVLMHVIILAMIGPFGHDWNSIVWPWTIAMALFDIILFRTKDTFNLTETFISSSPSISKKLVIVFFVMLPVLSFFNRWDSYLSSALYSGNITDGEIYLQERSYKKLPSQMSLYALSDSSGNYKINISNWSIQELNVPAYPETRIYKNVAKSVCLWTHNGDDIRLYIREHRIFNSTPVQVFNCSLLP